jgi:hypothetical protein
MRIGVGDRVSAFLPAPADPSPYYMGARVEVPYTREVVSSWQVATVEDTGDALRWVVDLDPPALGAGDYILMWRTGDPEPPDMEVPVPLMVVPANLLPPLIA